MNIHELHAIANKAVCFENNYLWWYVNFCIITNGLSKRDSLVYVYAINDTWDFGDSQFSKSLLCSVLYNAVAMDDD